ncbi:MAG TPA: AraC family transcriptional regulator, partial [Pseudomonas sp.]|nr:AraC family transcriptional regulator [Pseudomonas sp.]
MLTDHPLKRISILATDGVFASTLLHAKDFFHMASLRYGKQLGLDLNPAFETSLVSPDGLAVNTFSGPRIEVDGALDDADAVILPAFWGDFDAISQRYPQVSQWLQERHAAG